MNKDFGTVKLYLGNGISFDKVKEDKDICNVDYIEAIMEFQDTKEALFWAEELVNLYGAYVIPSIYKYPILGLQRAIDNFSKNI